MRTEATLRRRRAELDALKRRQMRAPSPEEAERRARDIDARITALEDEAREAERRVGELRDAERRAQTELDRIRHERRRIVREGLPAAEGEDPAEFYRAERVHHRAR